jgi:putative aldouronate transport system substrate-binding protein
VDSSDKVFYIYNSPQYREYLAYMNKLFTEKLIDNESFTQTQQQYVAKGNQSLIGSYANLAPHIVDTLEHHTWYIAIPPFLGGDNTTQMWPASYPVYFGQYAITNKNKYPEASIRWIDYFWTYEGGVFLHRGPEGLHWNYIDNTKTLWKINPVPSGFATSEEWRGTITPNAGTGTPGYIPEDFLIGNAAPHALYLEEQVKTYAPFKKDTYPLVKLSIDEQKNAAILSTDIDKYAAQMEARFITGDAPLSGWGNYLKDLNNMKIEQLTVIYQAAYNRYIGK